MIDSVSSRTTRHSTLFQGTGAPSQPNDEAPIFADAHVETSEPTVKAKPLKAANVGSLFDIRASQRATSSQPHHYAEFATGIRETPVIRCAVNYSDLSPSGRFSTFLAGPGWVALTGNEQFHRGLGVLSLNTKTGNCETFVQDGLREARTQRSLYLGTNEGLIMTGMARFDEAMLTIVSSVALPSNTLEWTQTFSNDYFAWLHPLPSGDFIGLYKRSGEAGICRLQAKTGAILFDKPCSTPETWWRYGGSSLQAFYCDDQTAVIGLTLKDFTNPVQLYSIDFATGDSVKLGTTLVSKSLHKLGTGQILSVAPFAPSMTTGAKLSRWVRREELDLTTKSVGEVLDFDARGAPQERRPFELTQAWAKCDTNHIALVSNKTHGVTAIIRHAEQKNGQILEFFEITSDGLKTTHTVSLNGYCDLVENTQLAITRDNVVYVSTDPMIDSGNLHRLAAYDAETGACLWEIFEDFPWGNPKVVVNSDDSITWLNHKRALVFEKNNEFSH